MKLQPIVIGLIFVYTGLCFGQLFDSCSKRDANATTYQEVLLKSMLEVTTQFFSENSVGKDGFSRIDGSLKYNLPDLFSFRYEEGASTSRFLAGFMDILLPNPSAVVDSSDKLAEVIGLIRLGEVEAARIATSQLIFSSLPRQFHPFDPNNISESQAATLSRIIKSSFNSIRQALSPSNFEVFLNLKVGTSLSFAIDTTGSMAEEINAARERVLSIIESTRSTIQQPLEYVLSPFNDPGTGPLTVTNNPEDIIKALNNLTAYGGGDGPEMALKGIEKAIMASARGSVVFFITDNQAKDYKLTSRVIALSIIKKIRVISLLTNNIPGPAGYSLYEKISSASGGIVTVTNKVGIANISQLFKTLTEQGQVKLELAIGSNIENIPFTVDSSLDEVTVILSAQKGNVSFDSVVNGNGDKARFNVVVNETGLLMLQMPNHNKPGNYTIHLSSPSNYSVEISGKSTFGAIPMIFENVGGIYMHREQPRVGEQARIAATVFGNAPNQNDILLSSSTEEAVLTEVLLVKEDGTVLLREKMKKCNVRLTNEYVTAKEFTIPPERFFIKLIGKDRSGKPFTRIEPSAVTPLGLNIYFEKIQDQVLNAGGTQWLPVTFVNKETRSMFTFDVSDRRGYVIDYFPSKAKVSKGSKEEFYVVITIPADAPDGSVSVVTVTATPRGSDEFVFTTFNVAVKKPFIIKCPALKSPLGTILSCTKLNHAGSVCSLSCEADYAVIGPHRTKCQNNGKWTSVGLACKYVGHKTCRVTGDPHYLTFDGRLFDYESTCISVASKTTFKHPRGNLEPFFISIENEHIGGITRVAWFKRAIIQIYGTTFVFSKERIVTVNGIQVTLPFSMANKGLIVSLSGLNVVMTTRFGLQVVYNGNFNFFIRLSKAYAGSVEGLCGNFNNNPADDVSSNSSTMALRTSGRINNNNRCLPEKHFTNLGECSVKNKYRDLCEIINSDCFEACKKVILPSNFLRNCIFDLCETHGSHLAFEQAISAYADRCQSKGINVCDWRNRTGVVVNCPSYSHFEHNGNGCPNTCRSPTRSTRCVKPNISGCVCNTGYVLSGTECVPLSECGCSANGQYYKNGQDFYVKGCISLCKCENASIRCHGSKCGETEVCGLSVTSNKLACLPVEKRTCTLIGGSHYTTFDGKRFDFQGNCLYTLAAFNDSKLGIVSISAENTIDTRRNHVTFETKSVQIHFRLHSRNINLNLGNLLNNQPAVKVEGLFSNTKVTDSYASKDLDIYKSGFRIFVRIRDASVSYGYNGVRVSLATSSSNQMNGLCGNFNGNPNDDFEMKNGRLTTNVGEFGNSFKEEKCNLIEQTFKCSPEKKFIYGGENFCGKIKSATSLFQKCTLDNKMIAAYYQKCINDVCASNGSLITLTNAFANIAYTCQDNGNTSLCNWRNETRSPAIDCPRNSHYAGCASACPNSCLRPSFKNRCIHPNAEDCQCDFGFVWSEGGCVKPNDCGCYPEHIGYVPQGYRSIQTGCKRQCSCNGPNKWECEDVSCDEGNTCMKIGSSYQCVPHIKRETCILWGESYVSTFDHSQFNFNGNCTYTLTRYKGDKDTPEFSVIAQKSLKKKNGLPGYKIYILTKFVGISNKTGQLNVTIDTDARLIYANGLQVNSGTRTQAFKVLYQGAFVVVKYSFGLIVRSNVRYSGAMITLPASLESKVTGLCGTYDNNPDNDFLVFDSSSSLSKDASEFGSVWRFKSEDILESRCVDGTISVGNYTEHKCENSRYLRALSSNHSCGILKDVAFQGCRDSVPPESLISSCIESACHLPNYLDILEENIMGYNIICSLRGHEISSARDISGADFDCPANSTYVEKMPSCVPTCGDPDGSLCKSDIDVADFIDSEGCLCDEGFLLSDDKCVPIDFCGCQVPNSNEYMKYGQCMWNANCTEKCQCRHGKLNCEKNTCYDNQYCGIRNGIHGCHYEDECRYDNGGCSHVCTSLNKKVTCLCPDEMYLTNERTCKKITDLTCSDKLSTSCQANIKQLQQRYQSWRIKYYKKYLQLVGDYKKGVKFINPELAFPDTPLNCRLTWSRWFDTDDPTGCGDDETLERINHFFPGQVCENALAIDFGISNNASNAAISSHITLRENNADRGLLCDNADQMISIDCPDYQVRFLCEICQNQPEEAISV